MRISVSSCGTRYWVGCPRAQNVNLEIEKSMAKRSLRVQGSMRVVVSQDGHALSLLR